MLVAGTTTALTRQQAAEAKEALRPASGAHPWPPELPGRRVGIFARDSLRVTLVEPTVVVEVEADTSFEFGRWRHPTRFIRLRPDLSAQDVAVPNH